MSILRLLSPTLLLSLLCATNGLAAIRSHDLPLSSSPVPMVTVGTTTFFLATDPRQGTELWRTDGSPAGTVLVRDINPGSASGLSSSRSTAITLGGRLFLAADNGVTGVELWSSDGSAAGTQLVADINPGAGSSNPTLLGVAGSRLFFAAFVQGIGTELWVTDGTTAGTAIVVDLDPGAASSAPRAFGTAGNTFLFSGDDGSRRGIFRTDGTPAGTQFVVAATVLASRSTGSVTLFASQPAQNVWTLARTDGTAGGTTNLRESFIGEVRPSSFTIANDVIFFVADDGVNGAELWRSDGTVAGTAMVADIAPGSRASGISTIVAAGSRVFFLTGSAGQQQLWVSDGTSAGTRFVANTPGAFGGIGAGGNFYFAWDDGTRGTELWRSDGTPSGTTIVADIAQGPGASLQSFVAHERGDGILFAADDGVHGRELWLADGAGARLVADVATEAPAGPAPVKRRAVRR